MNHRRYCNCIALRYLILIHEIPGFGRSPGFRVTECERAACSGMADAKAGPTGPDLEDSKTRELTTDVFKQLSKYIRAEVAGMAPSCAK